MPLARLSRLLWLCAALWMLGAAVWGWTHAQPVFALGLALLPLAAHALALALEMALARRAAWAQVQELVEEQEQGQGQARPPVAGVPPAVRPPLRHWVRAWAGEWVAALRVFGWQQPWRHRAEPDVLPDVLPEVFPEGAWGRRGVVLVHGFVCNRGFWNRWMRRLRRGGVPVVAVDLGPVFAPIEALVPALEQAVSRIEACTGRAPVVVAHSMGGLVLRCWWATHGGVRRVHRALTLGTPHHGTLLARWAFSSNTRQMRPHSAWLQRLDAAESPACRTRITCFQADCDNVVFPLPLARLDGADNRLLEGVAHVDMVDSPAVWRALQDALGADDPAAPGPHGAASQ
jgi:triacylglycerol esterase/lipase EstA (alpha/beta hydrolase family)